MQTAQALVTALRRMDRQSYRAYKDLKGAFDFEHSQLYIDYVQGDPFASPSLLRLRVPQSVARLPAELFATRVRRVALQDFVARCMRSAIRTHVCRVGGFGKSGMVSIMAGEQQVLESTAVKITEDWVEARLEVGLPAAGRTVLGHDAERLLCRELPAAAKHGLVFEKLSPSAAREFVETVENAEAIRSSLRSMNLVSFVADGAVLPRKAGNMDLPMEHGTAVPFQSPSDLRVSGVCMRTRARRRHGHDVRTAVRVPNRLPARYGGGNAITGMGIPVGVTLLVGGGYHGKSTVLQALERCEHAVGTLAVASLTARHAASGVYNHVPGDGREYVVTTPGAVRSRAEDGRSVENVRRPVAGLIPRVAYVLAASVRALAHAFPPQVCVLPFINSLPGGRSTRYFSTGNASGVCVGDAVLRLPPLMPLPAQGPPAKPQPSWRPWSWARTACCWTRIRAPPTCSSVTRACRRWWPKIRSPSPRSWTECASCTSAAACRACWSWAARATTLMWRTR